MWVERWGGGGGGGGGKGGFWGGGGGGGGGGGSAKANFLGSSRGIPPVTPTRGNPAFLLEVHSLFRYRSYRWNYIQRFSIYD